MESDNPPEGEEHGPDKPPRKMPKRKRQFCRNNTRRGAPDCKAACAQVQGQDPSVDGTYPPAPASASDPISQSITSHAASRKLATSELAGEIQRACFKNKSLSADLNDVTKKLSSANNKISALTESIKIACRRERDAKKQAKISEEVEMSWKAQTRCYLKKERSRWSSSLLNLSQQSKRSFNNQMKKWIELWNRQ